MTLSNLLAITENTYLSAAIWALVILIVLYLARGPFHRVVGGLGNIIYRAMRVLAAATLSTHKRLAERNRRVLLAAGRAHTQRLLVREFERIQSLAVKNLQGYPRIHRQLSEIITRLEGDYAKSADVPPSLPEWIPVIKTIAEIDHRDDTLVAKMLKEIHRSLNQQHESAVETYRQVTAKRHRVLTKWMPLWRKIQRHLQQTDAAIEKLSAQAGTIDRYIVEYEAIERQSEPAEDLLRANAWKQFFISALMLAIAGGAGFLNHQILSAALGTVSVTAGRLGSFTAAQTSALVLVLTGVGLGVFLMEALRVTHIFPSIGSLDEGLRRRFVWMPLALLVMLAGLEGLLIYLAPGAAAPAPELAAGRSVPHPLTVIGPAALGAILPIVLGFVAIPLETFATSARTVAGLLARGFSGGLAVMFRLTGGLACTLANLLATSYDLVIFPAIWLEDAIIASRGSSSSSSLATRRDLGGSTPPMEEVLSESSEP